MEDDRLIELTTQIVTTQLENAETQNEKIPDLIRSVFNALKYSDAPPASEPEPEELKPAVDPKKSVFDDYIICLEDGKKLKMLKRYIGSKYDLSVEEYRAKWKLPFDYPMVAPAYARKRSNLARTLGLGRKSGQSELIRSLEEAQEMDGVPTGPVPNRRKARGGLQGVEDAEEIPEGAKVRRKPKA